MPIPDAEAVYRELLARIRLMHEQRPLLVVGIHSGGAWLAQRLADDLAGSHCEAGGDSLGFLSSAFHRDDYAQRPGLPDNMNATRLPLSIDDREILLVDDVLYTGRTIRAALNELFDYGRPGRVQLAVLADRGGRQLPIQADFVGCRYEPAADQRLTLSRDTDGRFHFQIP
ncbi:MAG: bifunctional pyr operon transcriptional regulator/uracil phosphoribosyltransferase PyrR [Burkholderiaceae bacterium]